MNLLYQTVLLCSLYLLLFPWKYIGGITFIATYIINRTEGRPDQSDIHTLEMQTFACLFMLLLPPQKSIMVTKDIMVFLRLNPWSPAYHLAISFETTPVFWGLRVVWSSSLVHSCFRNSQPASEVKPFELLGPMSELSLLWTWDLTKCPPGVPLNVSHYMIL